MKMRTYATFYHLPHSASSRTISSLFLSVPSLPQPQPQLVPFGALPPQQQAMPRIFVSPLLLIPAVSVANQPHRLLTRFLVSLLLQLLLRLLFGLPLPLPRDAVFQPQLQLQILAYLLPKQQPVLQPLPLLLSLIFPLQPLILLSPPLKPEHIQRLLAHGEDVLIPPPITTVL